MGTFYYLMKGVGQEEAERHDCSMVTDLLSYFDGVAKIDSISHIIHNNATSVTEIRYVKSVRKKNNPGQTDKQANPVFKSLFSYFQTAFLWAGKVAMLITYIRIYALWIKETFIYSSLDSDFPKDEFERKFNSSESFESDGSSVRIRNCI